MVTRPLVPPYSSTTTAMASAAVASHAARRTGFGVSGTKSACRQSEVRSARSREPESRSNVPSRTSSRSLRRVTASASGGRASTGGCGARRSRRPRSSRWGASRRPREGPSRGATCAARTATRAPPDGSSPCRSANARCSRRGCRAISSSESVPSLVASALRPNPRRMTFVARSRIREQRTKGLEDEPERPRGDRRRVLRALDGHDLGRSSPKSTWANVSTGEGHDDDRDAGKRLRGGARSRPRGTRCAPRRALPPSRGRGSPA